MKKLPDIWIAHVPVLSTSHISEKTADWLGRHREWVASYLDGWWIFVGHESRVGEMPDDLRAVLAWAEEHDCNWVRLDSGGDCVEGLPTYDW